jgi:hypothetical protein
MMRDVTLTTRAPIVLISRAPIHLPYWKSQLKTHVSGRWPKKVRSSELKEDDHETEIITLAVPPLAKHMPQVPVDVPAWARPGLP